ncbi:PPOX class F420-dependent oxidoreductase [Nocardia implantans]|uniref:PPOX class F420-dependent oxidoreductase n=1 Tax=Nocardia implantans TaxID=3108168 RepID=A0ABU6AX85_9NOCA|nr:MULTISPECIES: PPOX class F420-dependent oxidoreductase [unclassified Nocardia]MBF6193748.1 PPOX class F420-dependent oxidoreductase [Nocardia beijingensis]MEA3529516.1 PPOX class F420-dependent oxidoreductase [Nocardia sp. CDC192]MEB3512102.1 PPOX class F420-dependent oxidoreductase [Nocardia sp. CDC186]
MIFTINERKFLAEAGIGRLATVSPDGVVQNNPTGYRVNADGSIDIGGMGMRNSRKYRNVRAGSRVSFVVDEQVSLEPYVIRGIEVRGTAEALEDQEPPFPSQERAVIRIHPERVISWGIDGGSFDFTSRHAE